MKKKISLLLASVLALTVLSGCADPTVKHERPKVEKPASAVEEQISLLNTCDSTIQSLTSANPDGINEVDHSVSAITGERQDKYVGMFYFLWNGMNGREQTDIYDATKLMQEYGADFWDGTSPKNEGQFEQYHYWGEPLFGYYSADDPFVLRRHIEMLTYAGIDFLAFDCSNESTYTASWTALLDVLQLFYDQGFDVPKVVFYTRDSGVNPAATSGVKIASLFDGLYSTGDYQDLWFAPNGKPMIVGEKSQCSKMIQNFFDFRAPQWPNETHKDNGLPWMDFSHPQAIHAKGGAKGGSVMSVSVAQHPELNMSDSVQFSDIYNNAVNTKMNWGRGYSVSDNINKTSRVNEGINFQQQWNNVFDSQTAGTSISTVFITGWNEWIAKRNYDDLHYSAIKDGTHPAKRVYMVDACNEEFSRDIEPMKGGYGDYYYLQTVKNVRAYKGVTTGSYASGQHCTININETVKQWNNVTSSFRDFTGDAFIRNHRNAANTERIVDNSARNDISEIRICHDNDNVYVMISTLNAITKYTTGDNGWMNVFLGVEGSTEPAFEEFQYLINRRPENGTTSIEKSTGGYNYVDVEGKAEYTVNEQYMQIKIPKSALGITGNDFTLKIKVTDNVTKPNDIMDYYVSGDCAPIGRFAYTWRAR